METSWWASNEKSVTIFLSFHIFSSYFLFLLRDMLHTNPHFRPLSHKIQRSITIHSDWSILDQIETIRFDLMEALSPKRKWYTALLLPVLSPFLYFSYSCTIIIPFISRFDFTPAQDRNLWRLICDASRVKADEGDMKTNESHNDFHLTLFFSFRFHFSSLWVLFTKISIIVHFTIDKLCCYQIQLTY